MSEATRRCSSGFAAAMASSHAPRSASARSAQASNAAIASAQACGSDTLVTALAQLLEQEGAGLAPVALDRRHRHFQLAGDVVFGHAGEIAHLDDAAASLVDVTQGIERAVQSRKICFGGDAG